MSPALATREKAPKALLLPRLLWSAVRFAGIPALGRAAASRWPFPVRTQLRNGRQMFVDLRSSIGRGVFATGEFDINAIRPALDALTPGASYIDIGANVGVYAMLALDAVGPSGQIHCFEMDPRPLRALRKTIATFKLSNIEVHECAVADSDGVMRFLPASDHGLNHLEEAAGRGREVRSTRLDTWAQHFPLQRLEVIKIDVEGAEKLVLEGARETIAKFKPLILCEAAEQNSAAFGYRPADLISLLQSFGYSTAWVDDVHTPTLVARYTG